MKVTIISEGYFPELSGVTVSLHKRLECFSRWGHQAQVFAPDYSALSGLYPNYKDHLGEIMPGITVHPFASVPYYVDYTRDPKPFSLGALDEKIIQFGPDVIHVECPERLFVGFLGRPGIKLARKLNIPATAIYHTNYLALADDYKEQVKFLSIPGMTYLMKKMLVWVYNSYRVLMIASPGASSYLSSWGVKNGLHGNYNGVDPAQFFPADQISIQAGNLNFLYAGRLTPDKGIHTLLQAFDLAYDALPNARFTIVGGGSEADAVNAWVASHPRSSALGRVPYGDMGAHFRAAHVLVSTCPKEQRPLSLLEAISCGLPILGPDSGGVKELVEHEQSGLLVTPSDPVSLSQAMIRVANDVELYRRLRDRTLSLSQYQNWELCSREMLQTWQNLPGNA